MHGVRFLSKVLFFCIGARQRHACWLTVGGRFDLVLFALRGRCTAACLNLARLLPGRCVPTCLDLMLLAASRSARAGVPGKCALLVNPTHCEKHSVAVSLQVCRTNQSRPFFDVTL
jgi:hypothetical protein